MFTAKITVTLTCGQEGCGTKMILDSSYTDENYELFTYDHIQELAFSHNWSLKKGGEARCAAHKEV